MLGVSEQALVATFPEIKRLAKPMKGPRNSRGKWGLPEVIFAAHPFDITFFISSGIVSRIELLSTASRPQCTQRIPFVQVMAELARTYGDSHAYGSFEDSGRTSQSVAFGNQVMDISLHYSSSPDDCATRVIYKTREVKDASEL